MINLKLTLHFLNGTMTTWVEMLGNRKPPGHLTYGLRCGKCSLLKTETFEIAKFKKNCIEHGVPLPDHKAYRDAPEDFEAQLAHVSSNIEFLLNSMELDFPKMPTRPQALFANHRPKIPEFMFPFSCFVARPVGKKEIMGNSKAQAALDKEWLKLVTAEVWLPKAREWSDVANEAKRMNKTIHVGRVFEICVEKGSELPE